MNYANRLNTIFKDAIAGKWGSHVPEEDGTTFGPYSEKPSTLTWDVSC